MPGAYQPLDLSRLSDDHVAYFEQIALYGRFVPGIVDPTFLRLTESGGLLSVVSGEPDFNGWAAGTRETGYEVGLTAAAPAILHFLFNLALRLPSTFEYIDYTPETPYRDQLDGRALSFRLPEGISVEEGCALLPAASRPRGEKRAFAASKLSEIASAFCMFHEVGHVIAGHTEYFERLLAVNAIPEFDTSFEFPERISQAAEREADLIAAMQLMSLLLSPGTAREHFRASFDLEDDETLDYQLLGIHIFVLRLLFLYLGQVGEELGAACDHPHPLVRITYVHAAVRLTAAQDLAMDLDILDPILDNASDRAARVWESLGLSVAALEGDHPTSWYSESVRSEVERLEDDHRELQSLFFEHSWIPEEGWIERPMD